jgi:heat shock protein 5
LNLGTGVFEVISTSGDQHLGGEDFDRRIIDYMMKMHKKKTGKDCSKDKHAVAKLRREAERAKRALSSAHLERIEIESFCDSTDLNEPLTRAKFEELNMDLFKKCIPPVQKAMYDAGLKKRADRRYCVGRRKHAHSHGAADSEGVL